MKKAAKILSIALVVLLIGTLSTQKIFAGEDGEKQTFWDWILYGASLVVGEHDQDPTAHGALHMPVGSILPYAGSDPPNGYFLCDGHSVSRDVYPDLYDVIETTYGGTGFPDYNLPDLRGRFPLGNDNMGDTSADRVTAPEADQLGGSSGQEDHSLTISEMANHNHSMSTAGDHIHSGSTSYDGNHAHSGSTSTTGNHSHTYYRAIMYGPNVQVFLGTEPRYAAYESITTNATGNHSHSISTSTIGDHSHNVSTNTAGDHTHDINSTGGGGPHNNMSPYLTLNYIIKY